MHDLRFVSIVKPSRPPRHWNIVESGLSTISVLWVCILPLSAIFLLDFGTVLTGVFFYVLHFIIASISVLMLIMKRMLTQWWSTISSLSIKPTIIFHIKLLSTKKTTTYVIEITGPGLGWHKRVEEYNRLMGSPLHVLLNLFFRSIWVHSRFLVGLSIR
jgi:hypothetical protein